MGQKTLKTFKDQSRINWYTEHNQYPTNEQIQTGCLQRIADATELMSKNYIHLQSKLKWMEESRDRYKEQYYKSERSNAALRGVITKLKNQTKKNQQ